MKNIAQLPPAPIMKLPTCNIQRRRASGGASAAGRGGAAADKGGRSGVYFVPAAGTAIVPDDKSDPEPAVAAAGDGGSELLNKNEESAGMMGQLSEGAAAALAPLTENVDVSDHLAVLTQVYRGKLLLSMTCRVRMSTLNHCMRRTPSHDRPPPPPSGLMSPPRGLAVWRWSGGGGARGVAVDQRPTFGGIEREGACHSRFITSARPTVPYDPDPRRTARTMPSSPEGCWPRSLN